MTKQEKKEQEAKVAALESAWANLTVFNISGGLRDMLDGINENTDVLNANVLTIPAYVEMMNHLYMAGRSAATVARIMGENKEADFIDWLCNQIARIEDEHNLG